MFFIYFATRFNGYWRFCCSSFHLFSYLFCIYFHKINKINIIITIVSTWMLGALSVATVMFLTGLWLHFLFTFQCENYNRRHIQVFKLIEILSTLKRTTRCLLPSVYILCDCVLSLATLFRFTLLVRVCIITSWKLWNFFALIKNANVQMCCVSETIKNK